MLCETQLQRWTAGMPLPCKMDVWHLDTKSCHKIEYGCREGSWGKEVVCDIQSAIAGL